MKSRHDDAEDALRMAVSIAKMWRELNAMDHGCIVVRDDERENHMTLICPHHRECRRPYVCGHADPHTHEHIDRLGGACGRFKDHELQHCVPYDDVITVYDEREIYWTPDDTELCKTIMAPPGTIAVTHEHELPEINTFPIRTELTVLGADPPRPHLTVACIYSETCCPEEHCYHALPHQIGFHCGMTCDAAEHTGPHCYAHHCITTRHEHELPIENRENSQNSK
jgi:hypothetical protein